MCVCLREVHLVRHIVIVRKPDVAKKDGSILTKHVTGPSKSILPKSCSGRVLVEAGGHGVMKLEVERSNGHFIIFKDDFVHI